MIGQYNYPTTMIGQYNYPTTMIGQYNYPTTMIGDWLTSVNRVRKFERRNNVSVSVNGYEDGKKDQDGFVYPFKVSTEMTAK